MGTVTSDSVGVRPTATTTYTLTAFNAAGSATAQATVTLTGGSGEPEVEPFVLKGRITNKAGGPVAGVKVFAEPFRPIPQSAQALTDAEGRYRVNLGDKPAVWQASAVLPARYEGQRVDLPFEPTNTSGFAHNEGAVRDFVFPGVGGCLGTGFVGVGTLFPRPNQPFPEGWEYPAPEKTELTLEPVGPILDGGPGEKIVGRLVNGEGQCANEGWGVYGVPLGRYKVSARYHPGEGRAPYDFEVRESSVNLYEPAASVTLSFRSVTSSIWRMNVEAGPAWE